MATSSSRKSSADKPAADDAAAPEPDTAAAPAAAQSPAQDQADENGRGAYSDKAAALAADVREYVDTTRTDLNKLLTRLNDDVQQTDRTIAEGATAEGVRRIPMASGDVTRALEGLAAAAAELQQRAAG